METSAIHSMAADRKRLHQCKLLQVEAGGDVQLARREEHPFAHAAVTHHAKSLVGFATIRETAAARVAPLTIDVGFDGTTVSHLHVGHLGTNRDHLDPELMTGNSRVGVERHLPEITGVVSPTNSNTVD